MSLRPFNSVLIAMLLIGQAHAGVVWEGRRSASDSHIQEIVVAPSTDLVLITGGYSAGLRVGMVCDIVRGNTTVGAVLVSDLRAEAGTALILQVAESFTLQAGDAIRARVLNS